MLFLIKKNLLNIILAVLTIFFTYHDLTGERGILRAHQRRVALEQKQKLLKDLQAERVELEAKAHYLRNDSLSLDLLEERAHEALGFVAPGDYVIREASAHG